MTDLNLRMHPTYGFHECTLHSGRRKLNNVESLVMDQIPSHHMPHGISHDGIDALHQVGMLDLLALDPRPIFVIDTTRADPSTCDTIVPLYTNPATSNVDSGGLLESLVGERNTTAVDQFLTTSEFRKWCLNQQPLEKAMIWCGFSWSRIFVAGRWRVISGTSIETLEPRGTAEPEVLKASRRISKTKVSTLDWTDKLPPIRMTPHIAWARSIEWSATALGSMSFWSSQLRSVANLVMQDPRPAVVFYGLDLIMIYNKAYIELLGG